MTLASLYRIGTTYPPTPLHLFDPPLSEPMRSIPIRYPITFTKGDGTTSGHGFPRTVWQFQILQQAEVDILLNILTVSSVLQKSRAGVYITTRSPENHNAFVDYVAVMHLPTDLTDKRQVNGLYVDLNFEFTRMQVYTP